MYRPLDKDDYVSFFILKGAGLTFRTIGQLFGCSATTVSRYLKKNIELARSEAEMKYGKPKARVRSRGH